MPEKNLAILLQKMRPQLHEEEFVFCSVQESVLSSLDIQPLCVFREAEGVTIIVDKSVADRESLLYSGVWSQITCAVNSDLNAVGFLASMSKSLADAGISVNAVSACFHDHLFVPVERKDEALEILLSLAESNSFESTPGESSI
ncbi:MAG TPA: ACT domain-containing protein [Planktothrix sp.]|jgi:hypothetical protein